MPVELDNASVKKLTHESAEIRLRTLDSIVAKLERALAHNEVIEFRAVELCKQLIRWFGYKPLQAPSKVLQLLARLLRSRYGEQAIIQIGRERFKIEMGKVQRLLKGRDEELRIVAEIQQLLLEEERLIRQRETNESDSEVIELTTTIETTGTERSSVGEHPRIISPPVDYEVAWSKPTGADFTSMKFLADIFVNTGASCVELQNALQHLQITMADYPAEYLLQAPNVYLNLLQLYDSVEQLNCPLEDVTATFLIFLKHLKARLRLRRNALAYACTGSSLQLQGQMQLKVSKALQLLLDKTLLQLQMLERSFRKEARQLFEIISQIITLYEMEQLPFPPLQLQKLASIATKLHERCEQDDHFTLQRIKYLLVNWQLQAMAQQNALRQPLQSEERQLLEPLLKDYTLKVNFPSRYEGLRALLTREDPELAEKLENLNKLELSFHNAVDLLKNPTDLKHADIIRESDSVCFALNQLKNLKLTELLLNAVVKCAPYYHADAQLKSEAGDLLLKLLRLSHPPLKAFVYQQLSQLIKKHFACLLNGENFCVGIPNAKLLQAQVIGVPLTSALLQQLLNESYESNDLEIKSYCEDMLTVLLKARHLLDTHWFGFLEILLPVVPLFLCCSYSTPIMRLLQSLYDPDAQHLPFLTVLQGNVGMLFHPDVPLRHEALTRLIYILNTLPKATDYMPNIMEISDLIANDICMLRVPVEYARIFPNDSLIFDADDPTSLQTIHSLLSLLESHEIDPLIRKSTLMQLNVMCQNYSLACALCNEGGSFLLLQALENSLKKSSYTDYADAAIPAVSLLAKLLFCDSDLRLLLSDTPNIYMLLLRALFLYQHDIQVRQDASICLFQLIFTNFMVVMGNTQLQVPSMLHNLHMPVSCTYQSARVPQDHLEYTAIFSSDAEQHTYLRHLIAVSFCGAPQKINKRYVEQTQHKQLDFAVELQLTQRDWRYMKSTLPTQNMTRFLRAMSNATEHKSLINAAISLQLQLLLKHETTELPVEITSELFQLLQKYLQLPPGNEMDFLLYEHLLELGELCLRMRLPAIESGFCTALLHDFQHAFLTLLKNTEIPLRLFNKLCLLLQFLLQAPESSFKADSKADVSILRCNLFELFMELIDACFESRELLRVRCLLALQEILSGFPLELPDRLLRYYARRLIKLSAALKSSTQTGAQWHRHCLHIICQLYAQLSPGHEPLTLNDLSIKYLAGLCGHSDRQVRALAWCILTQLTSAGPSEIAVICQELAYLPGGFLACCFSTLLDSEEILEVRQLAGNVFLLLLHDKTTYEPAKLLLEQNRFFRVVQEELKFCMLERRLPQHFDLSTTQPLSNCELISCYCRLCIRMSELSAPAGSFLQLLTLQPFMYRLYELLQLPPAHDNPAYYRMCADICQLYGSFYPENFEFLQRTICRNRSWLMSFCQLLDQPQAEAANLVNILQLLLVLCKDVNAYELLCAKLAKAPEFMVKLLLRAIKVTQLNTPLQRSALAALSLLLIKSQQELNETPKGFAEILEQPVEIVENLPALKHFEDNKENAKNVNNISKTTTATASKSLDESPAVTTTTNSATTFIFLELFRLFVHLYPTKCCKFESPPSSAQVQVTETLATLLKVSPSAQATASNLKLLPKIMQIFKSFFEEFKSSATTFVRRHGEMKKLAIIRHFQLLLSLLHNWYATPTAVLSDELQTNELCKILMQIWPWLTHSADLKLLTLQVCCFLSEHSFIVCQRFSVLISSYANSILQLITKIVVPETTKVKANSSTDFRIITTGIRVLMNCCACAEGRVALLKLHTLDLFDGLHPFNAKSHKIKSEVLHAWLQYWEMFSRYGEGAQARNLNSLCTVINRTPARTTTRLLCLQILRNMSFLPANRAQLLNSADFIYTVNEIITTAAAANDVDSYLEQLLVSVAIWRLICGGVKYAAIVRGTKLAKRFRMLREQLSTLEEENPTELKQIPYAHDLSNILDILLVIFSN